jgi:hypothetical protein
MSGFDLRAARAVAALAQRPRHILPATAAGLLATTVLFGSTSAWSACSPMTGPAGVPSNTTVTCSGTTNNQDSPNGYGTGQQSNDVVNVQAGASVTGTSTGLALGDNNTVNLGAGSSASGADTGVFLSQGTHVVNNIGGTISASGNVSLAQGLGTNFGATRTVTNTGTISGTTTNPNGSAFGINAGDVNVTNSGTISASIPNLASESIGIQGNNVTVANNGGTISASGTSQVVTIGVFALGDLTVTANTGTIAGTDAALASFGNLNVTNNAQGIIQAGGGAIDAFGPTTIANAGTITGRFGVIIDSSVTVPTVITNSGTITGTGGKAVVFSSASAGNMLTLGPGFAINGTVAGGSNNILQLGGTGSDTFNVSEIGPKYQGFVTFNKIDSSTWDLIGIGNQPWTVLGGTLLVDGTVGAVTVQNGGIAGGNGTVAGLAVNAGGTAAPGGTLAGSTIGTLNVAGNASFAANSTYQVEVNPAGQSDKILATGTTTLSGGTVQVLAAPGSYAPTTKYTILTSNSGVNGTFADATINSTLLTPMLSYDADDVFLTLTRNGFSFGSVATTPNQAAVAGALDQGPQNAALVNALLVQNDATLRRAFDLLSGEVFATLDERLASQSFLLREIILDRPRQAGYAGALGPLGALSFGGPDLVASADEPALGFASASANKAIPVKAAPAAPAASRDLTYWARIRRLGPRRQRWQRSGRARPHRRLRQRLRCPLWRRPARHCRRLQPLGIERR